MRIDAFGAPTLITWQLTRDCDLACLHCCTDSAPGRALPGELTREQAFRVAGQILAHGVPYVMLCGGEPTLVPHFPELAEALGRGGVWLKVETNGQSFTPELAIRLAQLPIRSIQISLDGDTQETYARQRPGGLLARAWSACELTVRAGMPLEVTFAPSRLNLHEAEAVIDRAFALGAFRFNSGLMMRLGTAAKLWDRLALDETQRKDYVALLERKEREYAGRMELCFRPLSVEDDLQAQCAEPAGTLLVLPDGRVKPFGPLPFVVGSLKTQGLLDVWRAHQDAWRHPVFVESARALVAEPSRMAQANQWTDLPEVLVTAG